jgi:hypothetical protein
VLLTFSRDVNRVMLSPEQARSMAGFLTDAADHAETQLKQAAAVASRPHAVT